LKKSLTAENDFTYLLINDLELFLKKIINNNIYITDTVLRFLNIYSEQLSFSYEYLRKKELIEYKSINKPYSPPAVVEKSKFSYLSLKKHKTAEIEMLDLSNKNPINQLNQINKNKQSSTNISIDQQKYSQNNNNTSSCNKNLRITIKNKQLKVFIYLIIIGN